MITFVKGDATHPIVTEESINAIVHVCNNRGGWGSGFVLAISKRWKEPEKWYREWASEGKDLCADGDFELGSNQYVPIKPGLQVINMVAQEGYGKPNHVHLQYDALEKCLKKVAWKFPAHTIHMPDLIGCGLAGGDRTKVLEIIERTIGHMPIFIYSL